MNSMLVCGGRRSCTRTGIPSLVNQTRNAGGGGRPGGAIVFNWKQKKILKISKDNEKVGKIPRFGYFDDIKHLVDESKIYRRKDLEVGFTLPAIEEEVADSNDKKKIDIKQLFGSHKSFGLIERKGAEEKVNFSHGRVFGVRKSLYRTGRSFHDDAKK